MLDKIYKICAFLVVFLGLAIGKQEDILEWRDYVNGKIPDDAIPAGSFDLHNTPIYIGLVNVVNGSSEAYIPTNILAGVTNVNVTLDDKTSIQVAENIKILCGKGDYLNRLAWYEVRSINFMLLFDSEEYRPVRAGWQVGEYNGVQYNSSLYLGKALSGNFWVGKIYTSNSNIEKNNLMYACYWNNQAVPFSRYLVLIYYY